MNLEFRKAELTEVPIIWDVLKDAIHRRNVDGSNQWQNGYPNTNVIKIDINNGNGFVLLSDNKIIAYTAVIINDEPEYARIKGKWLTNEDFIIIHRLAVADNVLGKGFAQKAFTSVEKYAKSLNIFSIKVDTNFDNASMLYILEKLNYVYCGEVSFNGSPRKAYEKVLS